MQFIKKILIALTLLISLITFAQSETTWITKKKDKSKKVEKVVKNETVTSWIKKKKENKKKFKEKKKESQTWISKKSKKEKKIEKKILKQYLEIANLPKANFYFTAKSENGQVVYGYVNSDKESDLMDLGGLSYFTKSNGYAYLDDGKTTCTVNSQLYSRNDRLKGDVVVVCKNKLEFSGDFTQYSEIGVGSGITNEGDVINFKFSQMKEKNLAFYKSYTEDRMMVGHASPDVGVSPIDINPDGKYYALLIGNSKYKQWATLTSPKNDINGIHKVLNENYNFEKIIRLNNASRTQIFEAFKEIRKISTDKDYVLIYYSGHGKRDTSNAYWIPVEAETDMGMSWINTVDISVLITKIQAKHILLLSDSCYVGTAFKGNNEEMNSIKKNEIELEHVQKTLMQRARWFISSGGNSQVVDEVVEGHSLFAYKIIDLLKNNQTYLTSQQLFLEVDKYNNQFLFKEGYNQSPLIGTVDTWGHLGGHFVFLPKKNK